MLVKFLVEILIGVSFIRYACCQSKNFFDRNCPLNDTSHLRQCRIHVFNRLDLNDFRTWLSELNKSEKVSLEVTCNSNGRFYVPWPMKANRLIKFKVDGCILEGWRSEFNRPSGIQDQLQEIVIKNSVCLSTRQELIDIIYKNVTQEYHCGQQTIHFLVQRNISYDFVDESQMTEKDENEMMLAANELLKRSKQNFYRCRYPYLQYIDQSISTTRDKFDLHLMTSNSEYYTLHTFLLVDNGFREVPQELVDWRRHFPQLSYLDLSNNSIASFDFQGDSFIPEIVRSRPLIVDLSNNSVEIIPTNIQGYLSGRVPIIVNLFGNPLKCDCSFIRYKRYVTEVVKRFPEYNRLFSVVCYSTRQIRLLEMHEYVKNNCVL